MASQPFEPLQYFAHLADRNKLCRQHGFKTVYCSGPDNIEGIMENYRTTENFVVIDDTTDNNVHSGRPGWFTRSVYTVWVLASVDYNDPHQRNDRMALCREIFRQFLSCMIADKAGYAYGGGMAYLALDRVYYKELGRYSFNGATGLYFMVENDVPTSLVFDAGQWV